jgi:hypothetical protein
MSKLGIDGLSMWHEYKGLEMVKKLLWNSEENMGEFDWLGGRVILK